MHPVSRIEIIVASQEAEKIIKVFDNIGVPNYTIISNVTGKGDFGTISDDMNLGSSQLSNDFIICYCSPDKAKPIIEKIRPILNKYGGVCYLSDAMEIRSIHCVAAL
ncbi:P-II family nitrogen regulator [Myxosarcina sp. GI1]|uniref:P-II family nitrogen regulator n=1 Tax=Myxosarcina sp. GI1 TaxID=1541065 RepID=UPI00056263F0|nr:nitrogen regulatory protein P-II [Myxosarcina sp. GI1]